MNSSPKCSVIRSKAPGSRVLKARSIVGKIAREIGAKPHHTHRSRSRVARCDGADGNSSRFLKYMVRTRTSPPPQPGSLVSATRCALAVASPARTSSTSCAMVKAVREHHRLRAPFLRAVGEPFVLAAPAFPTRGNSRGPSPSFCSPVVGPLNLSSAASGTRFVSKPCAGLWNVPGFGSRAGARNCSAGSRSCMGVAFLSRPWEHSGNGQGRTRAPTPPADPRP